MNPFTRATVVRFEHCDPAGLMFYPRFFALMNEAVEDWFAALGHSFKTLHVEQLGVRSFVERHRPTFKRHPADRTAPWLLSNNLWVHRADPLGLRRDRWLLRFLGHAALKDWLGVVAVRCVVLVCGHEFSFPHPTNHPCRLTSRSFAQ